MKNKIPSLNSNSHKNEETSISIEKLMFIMAATSLGYFVVQLDVSIVNLSLPSIQKFFNVDVSMLQWAINIYTLTFSVLLLSSGILGDRYGSKNFLIFGYALFFIGSMACGLASAMKLLLIFRAFQGVGAAMIVPNSLSIINKNFSNDKNLKTILITIWMSFGGIALTCGPIFGGIITSIASWRYIFLINLPICGLGIILTKIFVGNDEIKIFKKHDFVGQSLIFISSLTLLITIINYHDLTIGNLIYLISIFGTSLFMFIFVENKSSNPSIPLDIFKNINLQKSLTYGILVNLTYFGIVFFSSLYFRYALKLNSFQSGLAFIPITIPLIIANILSGKISIKYSSGRSINIGLFFLISGMLYLAIPYIESNYYLMLPAFILISFGVGLITPMITSIAMLSINQERGGMISAVINFFRQISGAFGVAIFGIFSSEIPSELAYRHFGVGLLSLVIILLFSIIYFKNKENRMTTSIHKSRVSS